MLIYDQLKAPLGTNLNSLRAILSKKIRLNSGQIKDLCVLRKSIDARKKPELFEVYSVSFSCENENKVLKSCKQVRLYKEIKYCFPACEDHSKDKKIVVIGMGPAGLFCAYYLALAGYNPLVVERGADVDTRKNDIDEFWESGKLLLNSNVQFGEGGAGTFSDGKLNTLVNNKSGRIKEVLNTFVKFGAPENILYDSKPHIGTDILINVVKNIRNEIINLGGQVRFNSQVTDIVLDSNGNIKSIIVNDCEKIDLDYAVLALGHSARDTFKMLYDHGIHMEQKPFAMGFRVQHNQDTIDLSQYGSTKEDMIYYPGAAPYKLACKTNNDRNVYSFCMCPGGYVVNASSEYNMLAINGMSYSGRNSRNANSAILMNVDIDDFPNDGVLAGVELQRNLEAKAYSLGNGKIPCCRFADFTLDNIEKQSFDGNSVKPEFKGQYQYADLKNLFPKNFTDAFVDGMSCFGSIIKGFDSADTIVAGIESRSSSPVRITRDHDFESLNCKGLYPCGEGAGYAGGIMSAAMDGIKVAEAIVRRD